MAKLYFRYGTMASAKTMNLLAVAHNYETKGQCVKTIRPAMDTRFGSNTIKSRVGIERQADMLVEADTQLHYEDFKHCICVLVDEAQFLSAALVDQLRALTIDLDLPVICYGLRTDFRTRAFSGSQRLFEVADTIEEVKTVCTFCERKAVFNMKFIDGKVCRDGPQIELGTEEKYLPACARCYRDTNQLTKD